MVALAGIASRAGLAAVAPEMAQGQIHSSPAARRAKSLTALTSLWRTGDIEGEAGSALAPVAPGRAGPTPYAFYEDTQYGREQFNAFRARFQESGGEDRWRGDRPAELGQPG